MRQESRGGVHRRASVSAGRIRRILTGLLAGAVLASLPQVVAPGPASAAEPMKIDETALDRQLFVTHVGLRYADPVLAQRDAVLSAELVGWRERNPTADAAAITAHADLMASRMAAKLTEDDKRRSAWELTLRLIEILNDTTNDTTRTPAAMASPTMLAVTQELVGVGRPNLGSVRDVVTNLRRSSSDEDRVTAVRRIAWSAVRVRALEDATFAEVWRIRYGAPRGIRPTIGSANLSKDPLLKGRFDVSALLAAAEDGNATELLAEAGQQFDRMLADLRTQTGQAIAKAEQLDAAYGAKTDGPTPSEAVRTEAEADAKGRKKYIDDSKEMITGLAQIVTFVDKDAGKRVKGIGDAAVKVATAINEYLPKIAGLGAKEAIFSLGTAALAGNIIGVVGALVPLFTGPSMEQQMMDQLAGIRDDIKKLSEKMDTRFDAIDAKLAQLLENTEARFDELLERQNHTIEKLVGIEQALFQLSVQLDTWGAEILAAQRTSQMTPLLNTIDGAVHHADKYDGAVLSWDDFWRAERDLHVGATVTMRAEPFVGPSPGSYANADVISVINRGGDDVFGPNGAIAYLDWYAATTYGHPGSGRQVADVANWNVLTGAYELMSAENPHHIRRVVADRITGLVNDGESLLDAHRHFSEPLDQTVNGNWTNNLFTKLVEGYEKATKELNGLLIAERDAIRGDRRHDMFGGVAQQAPAEGRTVDPTRVPACQPGSTQQLTRPTQVTIAKTPEIAHLARHVLPAGPVIRLCHEAQLVNREIESQGPWDVERADIQVTMALQVVWGDQTQRFTDWSAVMPAGEVCRRNRNTGVVGACYDVGHFLGQWDARFRTQFQSTAQQGRENGEVKTRAQKEVKDRLDVDIQRYYDNVHAQISNATTPLGKANVEVTKAVQLLQAYSKLGWARALEHDELLAMVLFGGEQLPADLPNRSPVVTASLLAARNNVRDGKAPADGLAYAGDCDVSDVPAAERVDPVSDCLRSLALHRTAVLADRYKVNSARLKHGEYVEGPPLIVERVQKLRMVRDSTR
ncbi:hypothetical protein [Micromonospora craterilacus]|uniref:hypothetical protein n=1 Tax=Micromonospora craterilacus TaxID=1655439 RepID=UPI0011B72EE5|nr:hypothetical protein [Micromonospora craterilacus]